jgi:acetylornithine/succinyldiaminopimelate/putrescine aminotransferase
MISERQLFLAHLAQTSDAPVMLDIERAEGVYLYGPCDKKYLDMISGISVSNLGHRHPAVLEAIRNQAERYLHTMVYGEYVLSPQVGFAKLLVDQLPPALDNVYLVNSGSEAIEGAMKLAKRYTGRTKIIACRKAYHGSTHGAMSLMGDESFKNAFRPLLPDIHFIRFNNLADLDSIDSHAAAVIVETIQGEAGVILPEKDYLRKIREKCDQTGSLMILDEIQTGFGRTGSLFAFENFDAVPDVFTIAKGMGGGLPIGAIVAPRDVMAVFKTRPALGHITTFGGHPMSSATAYATLKTILEENIMAHIPRKAALIRNRMQHKRIRGLRGMGLFWALELENAETVQRVITMAIAKGVMVDWFLFCPEAIRIAPPLVISDSELEWACNVLLECLDSV